MSLPVLDGVRLGSCTVGATLGRGAVGTVFRGERDGLPVAVKVLHPHLFAFRSHFRRFQREAMAGARVDHPGVVRVHECELAVVEGVPLCYLVMDLVEGRDLREVLATEGVFEEERLVALAVETARGLAAVHAAGLVHRDLKPDNLLLGDDGRFRITDLGMARIVEMVTTMTGQGRFGGSFLYGAPEHVATGVATPASDLHALGATLFEASLGRSPFHRETPEEVLAALADPRRPTLDGARPDLSPRFRAAVHRLLALLPEDRFPSAEALAEHLEVCGPRGPGA